MKTTKKKIAGDKIFAFRNRLNGEIVYSNSKHSSKFIDGVEFIPVFSAATPNRTNLIRRDSLERVPA